MTRIHQSGMTVVELSVGLAIGAIMLGVLFSLFPRVAAFHRVDAQVKALELARQGFFAMADEISGGREVRGLEVSSMTVTVYLFNPDYTLAEDQGTQATVTYRYDPQAKTIVRDLFDQVGTLLGSRVMMRDVFPPGPNSRLFERQDTSQQTRIQLKVTVLNRGIFGLPADARTFTTTVFLRNQPTRT
ncbi:MAG: hypothetical protein HYZ73_00470 [Elusimicrobia bacterium]|nr:hypothetical protein [Elusimicrobiota bacterium]